MPILETDRLILSQLTLDDAAFIVELLNDKDFLYYIGDRGVRTLEDAHNYIINGPINSYQQHGHGLYLTQLKDGGVPIGICGLLKRDGLDDVDLGFAMLPQFRRKGYTFEAASAVLDYGKSVLGFKQIVAITQSENVASIRILEKLGMTFEKMIRLAEDEEEIKLFA
jgi:RimJ/RimL family protein N-acetyltransferase